MERTREQLIEDYKYWDKRNFFCEMEDSIDWSEKAKCMYELKSINEEWAQYEPNMKIWEWIKQSEINS